MNRLCKYINLATFKLCLNSKLVRVGMNSLGKYISDICWYLLLNSFTMLCFMFPSCFYRCAMGLYMSWDNHKDRKLNRTKLPNRWGIGHVLTPHNFLFLNYVVLCRICLWLACFVLWLEFSNLVHTMYLYSLQSIWDCLWALNTNQLSLMRM